jgi:hypothetical protein
MYDAAEMKTACAQFRKTTTAISASTTVELLRTKACTYETRLRSPSLPAIAPGHFADRAEPLGFKVSPASIVHIERAARVFFAQPGGDESGNCGKRQKSLPRSGRSSKQPFFLFDVQPWL